MSKKPRGGLSNWAQLRFSIIGGLLARPPERGDLLRKLDVLASRSYQHPTRDAHVTFGVSTLERWYYRALESNDPVQALKRKIRSDAGTTRVMSPELLNALAKQYKDYPSWSYRLHADNVAALVKEMPELGNAPSYSTVKRRMKKRGWYKKSSRCRKTRGQKQALDRLEQREVRSYESSHVHALWHMDFHHGRLRIIDAGGEWHTPMALCVLDDRSRLCCHIQWYLNETAEVLQHGLIQAFHKRGLPRSLMTDNGSAMLAHETRNGLLDIGVKHDKTMAYSPYQNGKQESFWGQLEGRLLAMVSRDESLTMDFLNLATQAWAEMEYNRSPHEEISSSPLERLLKGPDVSRPSPDSEKIKFAFTVHESRSQRQSDGTLQIKGVRFEVPSRFRHFKRLHVRYQSWDLSTAWLVDERTGDLLARIYPQDKTKNAHGKRRTLSPLPEDTHLPDETDSGPHPPLLRKLLAEYAATGLPPAYIPIEGNQPATDKSIEDRNER